MFNKKELDNIQTALKELKEGYLEHKEHIKNHFNLSLTELKKEISALKETQGTYYQEFEKSLASFNELNSKYRKEYDNLILIKNQTTEKVLEKVEKELKQELGKHLDSLKLEREHFNSLQKELDKIREEVQRLQVVSQRVKEIDFELSSYIKKITEQDHEKLRLLKQVDDLQTLIAKMRQGKHR